MSYTHKKPLRGGKISIGATKVSRSKSTEESTEETKESPSLMATVTGVIASPSPSKVSKEVTEVNAKTFFWVGGEPTDDWSSLKDTSLGPASPYCYRTADPGVNIKTYQRATTGTDTKFGYKLKDYHISAFTEDVIEHMILHGLDTIFYLKTDKGIINCLEHYKSLSIISVKDLIVNNTSLYDPYDKENDSWAKSFLMDSLTPSLKKNIRKKVQKDTSAILLWLCIVGEVQSTSLR